MPSADGLLIVDKPSGWTSHDVVARVRRLAQTRRVGHAGTLDPMATGVLVVGIGRATRLLTFLVGCDKEYRATIRLGQATSTDDADGQLTGTGDVADLGAGEVASAAATLTGSLRQVPPAVSAIKVDGKRAYARARGGEDVQLAARPVEVRRFQILDVTPRTSERPDDPPGPVLDVTADLEVSSGTYVRALARDLGALLGVGAHLSSLRRTRVGRFAVEDAWDLPTLDTGGSDELPLLSLSDAARSQFPVHELTADQALALSHGRRIWSTAPAGGDGSVPVAAIGPDGRLVAMLDESGPQAKARVVFAPSGS